MKSSVKDLEILYEDNHLLAVNKPTGLLTQPNQTKAPSLEDLAKEYIKKKYRKKGNVFLHPIHRLDKPVSGIVLFARTSKALSRLNSQMRARKIQKTYAAKVEGHFKKKSGELRHQLSHGSHRANVKKNHDLERGDPVLHCKKRVCLFDPTAGSAPDGTLPSNPCPTFSCGSSHSWRYKIWSDSKIFSIGSPSYSTHFLSSCNK